MAYLSNQWYAAAWSSEITREPLMRRLFEEPVLFYRTEAGQAVALSDKCPHRFAPLHRGKLFGDVIRCPYHGLRFDPQGACVHNPIGKGFIPSKARVRKYDIRELNGIVWLWFGDEPADESRLVRFDFLDATDCYAFVHGYMSIEAHYTLVSDNLLDLSHAEFLHPNLGNPGANQRVKFSVEQHGDTVKALNWRPSEPPTVLLRMALGERAGAAIDMWSNVTWNPPAALCVEVGGTDVGGAKEAGVNTLAAHLITPETACRSHYFWKFGRTFCRDDAALSERLQEVIGSAFAEEDKPMIEAQQRNMGSHGLEELDPVYLESDGAAARARRVMARLAEQARHKGAS